jgi:hypothetical protein
MVAKWPFASGVTTLEVSIARSHTTRPAPSRTTTYAALWSFLRAPMSVSPGARASPRRTVIRGKSSGSGVGATSRPAALVTVVPSAAIAATSTW